MLQHCPDLRRVAVQTRRGDHRARSKRTEPDRFGRRSGRCGTKWGGISPPRRTMSRDGGEFSPFPAAVATLCPFLLPPIRRHRSVIRNCVSLSSPYPTRLYEPTNDRTRVPAYFFSFFSHTSFFPDLSVYRRHCPPVSFPLLPDFEALSLRSCLFFFFPFSFLARQDNESRESAIGVTTFPCFHVELNPRCGLKFSDD